MGRMVLLYCLNHWFHRGDRGCFVLGARINELEQETGLLIRALCDTNPARLHDAASFVAAGTAAAKEIGGLMTFDSFMIAFGVTRVTGQHDGRF